MKEAIECCNNVLHVPLDGYSLDIRKALVDWSLVQICLDDPSINEVYIPRQLPTGQVISHVSGVDSNVDYVKNVYKTDKLRHLDKIIFDDDIPEVMVVAFYGADVKEVHWPKSCPKIPAQCFIRSKIEIVSGIEDVVEIEPYVFTETPIKTIKWPERCRCIPRGCFSDSSLESITNVDHVCEIQVSAFAGSNLKELRLTQPFCEIGRSSFKGCDPATITFPFFTKPEQCVEAFSS